MSDSQPTKPHMDYNHDDLQTQVGRGGGVQSEGRGRTFANRTVTIELTYRELAAGFVIMILLIVIAVGFFWAFDAGALFGTTDSGNGLLIIENNSSHDICALYVAVDMKRNRGANQLPDEQIPVESGQTFTLRDIPPGRYDLRAESCAGDYAFEEDVRLDPSYTWLLRD